MDKSELEISHFFVVLPRVLPLSVRVRARPRTVLSTNTSSLVDVGYIDMPLFLPYGVNTMHSATTFATVLAILLADVALSSAPGERRRH